MSSTKPVLLCLHGWGGSKESFTELRAALKDDAVEILTPDLPGFGEEKDPPKAWDTDDYVRWAEAWLLKNHSKEVLKERKLGLLGHSHGGRIALKIAAKNDLPITHLYLCAAAGIRHPRHFKRMIGLTLAKTGKTLLKVPGLNLLQPLGKKFLYKLVRVHDYEKASPIMRQTLINVSREDLRTLLPQIHLPTDIFWGTDDRMTPVSDAEVMHQGIHGSRVHIHKGVRHAVHRDKAPEIAEVIRSTLLS
jgi:pimeloyl-ACP methyl ester carboxylesterase